MTHSFDHIDPGNAGGSIIIPTLPAVVFDDIEWACDQCSEMFADREALRQHKLAAHPLKRPSMHIEGLPARTRAYRINRLLTAKSFSFENVEKIKIDGELMGSEQQAAEKLCGYSKSRVTVALEYSTYSVNYDLYFDVLLDATAEQVEALFFASSANGSAAEVLRSFNLAVGSLREGTTYIAALQAYLTGILAKDRATETPLSYREHISKFGEALDNLEPIQRPLASGLVSLIRFILNDFTDSKSDQIFLFWAAFDEQWLAADSKKQTWQFNLVGCTCRSTASPNYLRDLLSVAKATASGRVKIYLGC